MTNFFNGKKLTRAERAKFKGFVQGCIFSGLIATIISSNIVYRLNLQYQAKNIPINSNSTINNLLHQSDIKNESLFISAIPEVDISDIEEVDINDSENISTTIQIPNNKNKNTLISDLVTRAEIREDGSLIKIIPIEDGIIEPNSIETLNIDFPISSNAKELKIEVFSHLVAEPISTKTFSLVSNETLNQ